MRVLIVTALFACASAAPSGLLAPVAVAGVPAVAAIPAVHAIAPVNAGDLQGALIDAKVKTEDYLRSVAEQQRESVRVAAIPVQAAPVAAFPVTNLGDLNGALIDAKVRTEDFLRSVADQQRDAVEQAVVDTNEKVIEANDQVQEKAVETFWADQEKKWQEYDAVQTAQAQLEGKIASESEAVAKSVVVPAVAPVVPAVAPVVPYSPYVVPGVIAPVAKTAIEIPEAPKPEEKKAEEPKAEEKPEEPKSDSIQVESAAVKTAEVEKVPETKYVVGQTPLLATFPLSPLKFAPQPWAPVVAPGIQTIVPYGAHVIAPTVLKTVW